jgi:uncharacterized protein with NRDE domain
MPMCLCVLVHQWLDDYPLVMAANREEHYDRPSLPPTWHEGGAFAGSDQRQGGIWQGVNGHGLLVALTNRQGRIQDPSRRSRGLLCLDVLRLETARASVDWLIRHLTREPYNPCNLLCADTQEAFAVHYDGRQASVQTLSPGPHLLADTDVDDPLHPRIQHALSLLEDLPEDWPALKSLLGEIMADHNEEIIPPARICIHGERAGTVSSSLIALRDQSLRDAQFHFADGPPCSTPYEDLSTQLGARD